jgi:rSAM/selenodomain-associated transferase 2
MSSYPLISIIIPVLNEAKFIEKTLAKLSVKEATEIIFVDGGSQDDTVKLIKKHGFTIITSPVAQRSYQMNLGAEKAKGDILLFLHSDTILPSNYLPLILDSLELENVVAGAFELKIDADHPLFRLIELLVNWRSHLRQLPYGDQAIFLTRKKFNQLNGFANLAIMEDFDLIKRLNKLGKIEIIKAPVITSARRWQKLGIFKTTLINQLMIIGYYLGIDSHQLARCYQQFKD